MRGIQAGFRGDGNWGCRAVQPSHSQLNVPRREKGLGST